MDSNMEELLHNKCITDLNNVAVDLTNAGSIEAAQSTLHHAIQMMQDIVPPHGYGRCIQSSLHTGQQVLRNAKDKLQMKLQEGWCLTPELATIGSPLKIQSAFQGEENNSLDLTSAVLMYNFGIVRYWATNKNGEHMAREQRKIVMQLFSMSIAILRQRHRRRQIHPEDMSEIRLLLLLVVLTAQVHTESEIGHHSEAMSWSQELDRCRNIATTRNICSVLFHSSSAAAAAA